MMTVNDLLALDLPAQEFKAACYMLTHVDGDVVLMDTANIAALLHCSTATARRVIANLVEIGLFVRTSRGVFLLQDPNKKRSQVSGTTDERSLVSDLRLVYVASNVDSSTSALVETNVSTNLGGFAPMKGGIVMPIEYDEGEGLFGVGMSEPRKEAKRHSRKKNLKFHRLTPREEWDMAFVAREFRHQMFLSRPDILGGGTDSRALVTVLSMWKNDHGLTVLDAAAAVDMFFSDTTTVSQLKETPKPYSVFLRFLQDRYRILLASTVSDDWLASLDAQMEDFK